MPLTRYRVRSEYGLADPELYGAADKDDPEALLEGVAMAGLVGVLRQLGDLAEFAAEIFHDLHEEVMATATRGHGLIVRVQQLEAEFPPIEKALLSQTSQSSFFYNPGIEWHPNLRSEQNLIARGDLPRFVMDSYEESRGPPRLFLLDKFDVAGAGACLKRYTDPSFFKVEAAAASGITNEEIPREKKNRRVKQKKGLRWRNGETTPEVVPASQKLQQLFLEERIESGFSDPARLVKLKKRNLNGSVTDPRSGKSYMEKFVDTREIAPETSIVPVSYTPEYTGESGIRILEISTVSSAEKSPGSESACSSPKVHMDRSKRSTNRYDDVDDSEIIKVPYTARNDVTSERSSSPHDLQVDKQLVIYGEGKTKGMGNGYESDDVTSEVDNYMDALANMESEIETDIEYQPNSTVRYLKGENHGTDSEANEEHLEQRTQLSDSQSIGNFSTSDDGNNSFKRNRSSFSYSDSPVSLVENTRGGSDNGAKISPSTVTCESEIVNELSTTKEPLAAMSQELVLSTDMFTEEENTNSRGEASSQLHSDSVASSSTASLVGPKIGETPKELVVSYSKVPDTVENEANLLESTPAEPRGSFQIEDDFTKMPESYLTDKPVAEDPHAISDDLLHRVDTSELVSETESRHSSVKEELKMRDETEASDEMLVIDKNEPRSVAQKQLGSSTLPDSETSSSDLTLPINVAATPDCSDVIVPEVDDFAHTEDLPPDENISQVDSPQTRDLEEPHLLEFTKDVPPVELVSAGASLFISKEEQSNRYSGTIDFEEASSSTCHEDADGDNAPSLEQASSCLHEPDADTVDKVSNDICLPAEALCSATENRIDFQEPFIHTVVSFREEHGLERDSGDVGCTSSMLKSIVDSTETSASVETRAQEPESVTYYDFNGREDGMSLPAFSLPQPPADQGGTECPILDEAHQEMPPEQSENSDLIEVDQPSIESPILPYKKDDSSQSLHEVYDGIQAPNPFGLTTPNIVLLPEAPQVDLGELPPLPPLPPMQWRMGLGMGMGTGIGNFGPNRGLFPPIQPSRENEEAEIKLLESQTGPLLPQNQPFALAISEDEKSHPPTSSMQLLTVVGNADSQHDQVSLEVSTERQDHEQSASSSSSPAQTAQSTTSESHGVSLVESQPLSKPPLEAGLDAMTHQQSLKSPEEPETPIVSSKPPPTAADEKLPLGLLMPGGKNRWLPNHSGTISDSEVGIENGVLVPKIPRPRNPLIDAVNAHGTSKLRKVTERVRPELGPKVDERDSLLEQIRTKSFSLKPATATRPSIGPAYNKTNLKVAAILEKANAIRQSLAGSDDEDDDNWD